MTWWSVAESRPVEMSSSSSSVRPPTSASAKLTRLRSPPETPLRACKCTVWVTSWFDFGAKVCKVASASARSARLQSLPDPPLSRVHDKRVDEEEAL
eukprot:132917-Chlamydomonas_euryale.AAC.3